MAGPRSYRDLCGIARALDVVGERWALLVVRELLLGPKRFADLQRGLTGISPNVLAQRLSELEASGVVERVVLGPPASTRAYGLTDRGRALEPVLVSLGRWGSPMEPASDSADLLSPDALAVALKTTFDADAARGIDGLTFDLRLGVDRFTAHVDGGRIIVDRAESQTPAATITCDVRTLQGLVFAGDDLDAAVYDGRASVEGDVTALKTFLTCFPADASTLTSPV